MLSESKYPDPESTQQTN